MIKKTLLFAVLAFSSCCLEAAEVATQQSEHTLVRVTLETGESAGVLSKDFTTIDYAAIDGGIVWTAPPGRYAVIVSGGTAGMQILPVQIGRADPPAPGPVPPDPPGPTPPEPLDGVGSRLYPIIKQVGDKATALKLASSYRTVLEAMNDGSILSAQVARTRFVNLNNGLRLTQNWKPAIDAMLLELQGAIEVEQVQKVFRGTIAALELAAK